VRHDVSPKSIWMLLAACLTGALAGAGGATAAGVITGAQVRDSSLTGRDIKNRSLTRHDFRGSVRGRTGPAGERGPVGPPGPTSSAYAVVGDPGEAFNEIHPTVTQSRGFSPGSVRRIGAGTFCLVADPPVTSADRVAVATVDLSRTNEGIARDATVVVDSNPAATPDGSCPAGAFKVRTYATAQSGRVLSNNVAFTILIP
jgi:hypothetical protein